MDRIYIYKKINKKTNIGDITNEIIDSINMYNVDKEKISKVKRVLFESEKNIKLYAQSGEIEINIENDIFRGRFKDKGPGIENIQLAFKEGYTTANNEIKEKGYGLGKGLGIIQENSDTLNIASELGVGTTIDVEINLR